MPGSLIAVIIIITIGQICGKPCYRTFGHEREL